MAFLCSSCGYSDDNKVNAYGTHCPSCNMYFSSNKKSALHKLLDDRDKKKKTMLMNYLKNRRRNYAN